MNIYVVVEGKTEAEIYLKWIPYVNPKLSYVNTISEINDNNFTILCGFGYPNYFDIIENAINDINLRNNINRLIIAVDSEEMSYEEKYNEISDFIKNKKCISEISIIIQHFCIETWALGNRKVGPRNPKQPLLAEFKNKFNVLEKDPEYLPNFPKLELNRSQFALKYLKEMLKDKNKNLSYNKNNPKALLHPTFFNEIKTRLKLSNHIKSFNNFLISFN